MKRQEERERRKETKNSRQKEKKRLGPDEEILPPTGQPPSHQNYEYSALDFGKEQNGYIVSSSIYLYVYDGEKQVERYRNVCKDDAHAQKRKKKVQNYKENNTDAVLSKKKRKKTGP